MKQLLIILSILSITSQAQEGINYQGVATNGSGVELINQNISIKASVISDSANGTIQWQETHSTTTDQFGLFNLVIGQGASTGSGQSSSFEEIQWGSGNHFLKIEMDATGGNNYSLISTSQMMSVPYALYAKNANINYDSIASIISNTSANNGLLSANDICIDAENVISISFTGGSTFPSGVSSLVMDDSSNIYISLNGHGHPNNSPGGGEIRKYDVNLNLIWTRTFSTKSPAKLKFINGGLFVSGKQGYNSNDYVSRIDISTGSDIWNQDLSYQYYHSNLLDGNSNYIVYVTRTNGGYNNAHVHTFDFSNGSYFNTQTNMSNPNSILVNGNTIYITGNSNGNVHGTLNISNNGTVSSTYSYGGFSYPSSPRDWIFSNGNMIKFSSPDNQGQSYPEEQNLSYIYIGINNNIQKSFNTGKIDYFHNQSEKIGVLKSSSNGFSLGISFTKNNMPVFSQFLVKKYVNYGYAIIDFDNNGNVLDIKNLSNLSENIEYATFDVSTIKHAVAISVDDNICVNNNLYSGLILMVY